MYRFSFAIVLFTLLSTQLSLAQTEAEIDSVEAMQVVEEEQPAASEQPELFTYIPPLHLLIDSALVNSPEVAYYNYRAKAREYEVSMIRKDWSENIAVGAQYNFGNQGAFLNQLFLGYQFTVGVQIPLSTFIGRSDRINQREAEMYSEQAKQLEMERKVEEQVIQEYNNLVLLKRLLEIQAEAKESANLIMEMSEERFREGELSLDQLGANTDLKAKSNSEYERLRIEFANAYQRLERLVGVPFSRFENTLEP
ncbi:MAG: TolC family protein [Flavobacteriia bacterium]|nr:TolC family protein [Flavobacteriia bacterium]